MTHYLKLGVIPAYLLLCLILGGASAAGFWANMALQLLALPIIVWSLTVRRGSPMPAPARQLMLLLVLMLLVVAVQLVPLPPSLWTALPGRHGVANGFEMLGMPLPWLPISLSPQGTISSALWLLPAFAVLLGIIRLGAFRTSWLTWSIILVAAASVLIGALQIAGGDLSPWYFYKITNYGATTGFFSNSNHMATLLLVTIPFLAALYLGARRKGRSTQRASGMLVIVFGAIAVVLAGIVINRSLAGLGLAVPVVSGSLLMIWSRKRKIPLWAWLGVALLAVAAVGVGASAPFSGVRQAEAEASSSTRSEAFGISARAALDYLPLGSGVGSFNEVYPMYEDPTTISRFYMNHVHNDYIELALETGVLGLAVLLLFLLWWGRRTIVIWSSDEPDHFARAATIASAAILVHSLVDYPLRTAAISAVFAVCCGLMSEPRARVRKSAPAPAEESQPRHLSAD
jgi:O-antigen ligase